MRNILFVGALLSLGGCSLIYQKDVQQGNVLKESLVSQLHKGMSKEAVIDVLGRPALEQLSDTDWTYVENRRVDGKWSLRKVHITFEAGVVSKISF